MIPDGMIIRKIMLNIFSSLCYACWLKYRKFQANVHRKIKFVFLYVNFNVQVQLKISIEKGRPPHNSIFWDLFD